MLSYSYEELAKLQEEDEDLKEIRHLKKARIPEPKPGSRVTDLHGWLQEYASFEMYHDVLYREVENPVLGKIHQLLVPRVLRETMLEMTHDKWGHQGVDRTLNLLRERCYWPGMTREAGEC